ncbi:MAG TPA: hypothetical protein VFM55_03735 [Micromonosporaceae bacterium]|nr:hypothetical protein [Micromonosporaceae bacterium]
MGTLRWPGPTAFHQVCRHTHRDRTEHDHAAGGLPLPSPARLADL